MNKRTISPIHIVASRLPDDGHDWTLIRGEEYKCALCEYVIPIEPIDILVLRSGCSKSKVAMGAE